MYKTYDKEQEWSYEACSDLSVGDGCYPAFSDKEAVFVHCMNLIRKHFNVKPAQNGDHCIKKLYKRHKS